MTFDPTLAAIRFGTGLSPARALPRGPEDLLRELSATDTMAAVFPITPFALMEPNLVSFRDAQRARREAKTEAELDAAQKAFSDLRRQANVLRQSAAMATFARSVDAEYGLRERLLAFWADHFTVRARNGALMHTVTPYVEEAIRPYISGRFRDMLRAVTLHPSMLLYLEQQRSFGPTSPLGLQRSQGLNENLARELMELHTLGVDGTYSQGDVRQLAELLTGLTFQPARGAFYDKRLAEPGSEEILGVTYAPDANIAVIERALDDLASHPDTARHIAGKLARHFVSLDPDPGLVADMATVFAVTDGDLMAVMGVMLDHPAAWTPDKQKVRTPMEYLAASLRALGVPGAALLSLSGRDYRRFFVNPLRVMGQPWERPIGPDGWSEDPADWIIPQAMAARITWAMKVPRLLRDPLPDPRAFVEIALGAHATQEVRFAAGAAQTRAEGVGLVLASAAFQRR